MSNYSSLKATINANIKTNGNQEITGSVLNSVLKAMVDTLGAGYSYIGIATPATNPGTPDYQIFYIANEAGTYTNFDGLVVNEGELAILKWRNSWLKDVPGVALASDVAAQMAVLSNRVAGCFVDLDVSVESSGQRTKNYNLTPGSRIVIQVTNVSGTGTTYNAYWIKSGGNVPIFTGMDYGYTSDVLVVPDDATGVSIFMTGAAVGNVRHVKIFDASLPAYVAYLYPQLQEDVETLLAQVVNFTGTDGTNPGTPGLVPAPAAADRDKVLGADGTWKTISDYFYNENVSVNTNSQRYKSFALNPGSKIVLRITSVSGTSSKFSLEWNKNGSYEYVLQGYPFGYITDVLVVPDDAIGIRIFMTPAASGNVNKVEIWNAEKSGFISEKIGQFGFDYLNNRKMISKTISIPANNAAMNLVTYEEGLLANLSGDIYAYMSISPKVADDIGMSFWNTEDSSSGSVSLFGIEMRQDKLFKIFSNKTLQKVTIPANFVSVDTEMILVIFAVDPAVSYLNYPLYGKKIMCFGDSLTQFKSGMDGKRYSDHLQEYSQADVKNAGIGGTRYAQRTTPSLTPADNQVCVAAFDVCNMVIAWATGDYSLQEAALASGLLTQDQQPVYETKINVLKNNPIAGVDIVTIMAGANDYRGGSPVGLENQETMDKGTIRGAINAMVSALLAAKPTIEINFFSPLIMMMGGRVGLNNSSDVYIPSLAPDGMTFPAYIEKIHEAVKGNHCPFNDMYWSLGFNVYNFTTFFGDDLSHPYRGFQVIAERMYKYLLAR